MGSLDGKVALVTGSSQGIGAALAIAMASEGAKLVVSDIQDCSDTARQIKAQGGEAIATVADVTDNESLIELVAVAEAALGPIDLLVNNAGIFGTLELKPLMQITEDEWDAVIATHLKGHFTVFRHAAAIMRKQESGSLVGFTSGAYAGSVAQANYSAAKGGIVSLVRSAAVGLHRYGVRANAVAPVARTRMSANVPSELAEMGDPEDVAPLVVFLLSDAAKDVTGQVYTAVGGRIAVWNQPVELRSMSVEGRWTPEQIAARFDEVGQERMGLIDRLEQIRKAAASGEKPNA